MSNQQAASLLIAPIKVWASIKQCYVVGLRLFIKLRFVFVQVEVKIVFLLSPQKLAKTTFFVGVFRKPKKSG